MTSFIFGQYWLILFLWVGLAVSRRYISRYPNLAIILVLARSFFRVVVLSNETQGDRTFSNILAAEWLIIALNSIAIAALFAEIIGGHRCWRIRLLRAKKRRRARAAELNVIQREVGKGELMNSSLLKNIYDQFHAWFQTVGIFIVAAICSYLVNNTEWTWKGIAVAAAAAFVNYAFTRDDHAKTRKAVKHAVEETVIATQEVLENTQKGD
jgi:hypothetical protein